MTQARECSVLFDSHQCVNDLACIPFDKIQNILETDLIRCITQLQFGKAKAFCCFTEKRKDDHSKNDFSQEMGGKRPALARALGPAPHFLKKFLEKVAFFCKSNGCFMASEFEAGC